MTRRLRPDHLLYRLFDADGALLYIGRTSDLKRRLQQHASFQPWWSEVARSTAETHTDLAALKAAERAAILAERPRYNLVFNDRPYEIEDGRTALWLAISPRLTAAADALHEECRDHYAANYPHEGRVESPPCSLCAARAAAALTAADLAEGRLDPTVEQAAKEAHRQAVCRLWQDPLGRCGPSCGAWECFGREVCRSAMADLGIRIPGDRGPS